jgi:uncharacterized protein
MKTNPFSYGVIVTGEDYCPRTSLEKTVRSNFLSGQNMALHGERRIGKTSLITNVAKKLPKKRLVYVDFLFVNNPMDVVERIAQAVLETANASGFLKTAMSAFSSLRPTMSFDPLNGAPTFSLTNTSESHYTPKTIEEALQTIYSLNEKQNLVVIFDEFQDILRIPQSPEILAKMRSRIQFQSKLSYAFTGSHRSKMEQIFSNPDNPFYKSAMTIAMDPISGDDLWAFLTEKFKKSGIRAASDLKPAIEELKIETTGDIQQLCKMIWDIAAERNLRKADSSLVSPAIEAIFGIEKSGYDDIASSISPSQLKLLKGMAKMGTENIYSNEFREGSSLISSSTITSACKGLEQRRIIYKKGNVWKIDSPFFRLWLSRI